MLFQSGDDGLGIVDGPQVLDDDLTVRHDEDDGGEGTDLIGVADATATCWTADGRVFNAVCIGPVLAGCIAVAVGDFYVEHIVHVAAHGIVGFHYFGRGLLARATSGEEEVDEYGLATVEDVKQVDFSAVAVGSRKVDGLCERTLRFQAKTDGQREKKGNNLFHR